MRQIISTPAAPAAIGPYSQAVRIGNLIFTSGQIPLDPVSGKLVEGTVEEQTRQVLENVKAVLEAAGSGLERVVKSTVFIKSMMTSPGSTRCMPSFFRPIRRPGLA